MIKIEEIVIKTLCDETKARKDKGKLGRGKQSDLETFFITSVHIVCIYSICSYFDNSIASRIAHITAV